MTGVSKLTLTERVSLVSFESLPTEGREISALLAALANGGVNLDMISQSVPCAQSVSLSFTISDSDLVKTLHICRELSGTIEGLKPLVSSANCKLQLYGEQMAAMPGVAAAAIATVYALGCEIQLISTSEVDISLLISRLDADRIIGEFKNLFGCE
ncbi:MAG: hypothetical protein RR135_03865 [Oscillospiraceae bacterium]